MDPTIILYIIFGVGLITGILFIRRGFSRQSPKGGLPMVLRDNPRVPPTFDVSFIEQQLITIQNRPDMIANYFTTLRTTFSLDKQIEILNKMQARNLAIAGGIKSRKQIFIEERDFQLAQKELETVHEEMELRSTERKAKIAENLKRIRDLEEPKQKEDKLQSKLQEYEDKLRYEKRRERISRQIEIEEKAQHIRDAFSARRLVKKVGEDEEREILNEYLRGRDISELKEQEKEALQRDLEDLDEIIRAILAS